MKIGNGYYQAMTLGQHGVIFVNKTILTPKEYSKKMMKRGPLAGGVIGALALSDELFKQQVCYLISNGADDQGCINISFINDDMMDKFLKGNGELSNEYYSKDSKERNLAEHVLPILKKAGLFTKVTE